MRFFTDRNGHQWEVSVTVGAIKRVRALTGLDLYKLVEVGKDGELDATVLERLAGDPVLLVDVLFAVCKPQADAAGITDEQFGEAMAGDAIAEATDALIEDILDFFPGARRKALREIWEAGKEVEAKAEANLDRAMADGFRQKVVLAMESAKR